MVLTGIQNTPSWSSLYGGVALDEGLKISCPAAVRDLAVKLANDKVRGAAGPLGAIFKFILISHAV
jgi:hypothetical protein